jgi:hypothetical protein
MLLARCKDNIKIISKKLGDECGFDSSGSGYDLVMDGLDTS